VRLLAAIKEVFDVDAAGARGHANGLDARPIEGGKYTLDMLAGTTR
jgi:hypothetical protein